MKKLYFLNESEKERILHLHENRTKNQYLLLEEKYLTDKQRVNLGILSEAVDRSSLTKTVSDICSQETYGSGSFTEKDVNTFATFLKDKLASNTYKSNEQWKTIAETIKNMKTISNYCKVVVKYKEIGGRMFNNKLIDYMSRMIYSDNAWELYIKVPFEEIIKNAQTAKPKEDTTAQVQNQTLQLGVTMIKNYCSASQGGKVNDAAYEVFKFATSGFGPMSTPTYNNVLSKIKTLSINDFCAIYRKYQTEVGQNLVDSFLTRIILPYYKQEIITLISSIAKGSPQAPMTGTSGVTPSGGGAYQVAGGYVFNSAITPQTLQAIRTKIGSTDTATTLTQNDINLIYQKLG